MTDEKKINQQDIPVFRMQKMYIKDLSFENPNAPQVFLPQEQEAKVDFNLRLGSKKIDEDHYEVSIFVNAKVLNQKADDAVMFVVEMEHAAVFLLKNIPMEHVQRVLAVDCPLMLFPFTRQIASQLSVDGGFMPFLMEPINFVALYERAQQKEA
ncbi:protein-export chaperone SecB [Desulfobulbus sp. F1]|jgi:preprotein translocase subunit SecB|uniref:Protein translocase subunit secB n=1 Tax=Candidatus Electronema aureum TaxID=2005002 RepID=A0A521G3I9_9BACT|nr:protein-export chaperone SecB [Desulfobulbus sp. F1]TAA75602.1 MAG: protein translocase subunit secB [Candidatus Electronema aureum]